MAFILFSEIRITFSFCWLFLFPCTTATFTKVSRHVFGIWKRRAKDFVMLFKVKIYKPYLWKVFFSMLLFLPSLFLHLGTIQENGIVLNEDEKNWKSPKMAQAVWIDTGRALQFLVIAKYWRYFLPIILIAGDIYDVCTF